MDNRNGSYKTLVTIEKGFRAKCGLKSLFWLTLSTHIKSMESSRTMECASNVASNMTNIMHSQNNNTLYKYENYKMFLIKVINVLFLNLQFIKLYLNFRTHIMLAMS